MPVDIRLANETWESLLTAHAVLMRGFGAESVWSDHGITMREYDVLYTLAKCPAPARVGELRNTVLLSQPALSRLVDRLERRGLVARDADHADGRAVRVALTDAGRDMQRTVGRAHARSVARAVGGRLDEAELHELHRLTVKLLRDGRASSAPASAAHPRSAVRPEDTEKTGS
ncbi:MarR family transcriptional regulator [Leucobacter weissii]|uniref:MarR family transcriptional regulator n=1 Tax=Leucobacter weissii TaxID=1983706 RepID=A0A939SBB1_9MICO|nr:MarR family transcriptional regulator [Leucobacter weissii]MBO1902817.1 MarR family transcriptional regulator [Leucobacter weissii]